MKPVMEEPGTGKRSFSRTAGLILVGTLVGIVIASLLMLAFQRLPCELAGEVVRACERAHDWSEVGDFIRAVGLALGGTAGALYGVNVGARAAEKRKDD